MLIHWIVQKSPLQPHGVYFTKCHSTLTSRCNGINIELVKLVFELMKTQQNLWTDLVQSKKKIRITKIILTLKYDSCEHNRRQTVNSLYRPLTNGCLQNSQHAHTHPHICTVVKNVPTTYTGTSKLHTSNIKKKQNQVLCSYAQRRTEIKFFSCLSAITEYFCKTLNFWCQSVLNAR